MRPCSACNRDRLPGKDLRGRTVYYCPECGDVEEADALQQAQQRKLPGLEPGRPTNRAYRNEEQAEREIDAQAARAGWSVLSTVHRHTRHTCSRCGHNEWHRGGYGASPGIPDRLLFRHDTPRYYLLGVEVKGDRTEVSPEQQRLADQGRIIIARCWRDVEEALKGVEV